MGYALFANRKIFYTNLIFNLQSRIDNILQQKQNMLTFSANIADGVVSVEDMASDPTNFGNYCEFLAGADAFKNTADEDGGAATTISGIGGAATDQSTDETYLASVADMIDQGVNEKFAQAYSKRLEAEENRLDLEQKKLETKLSAAQSQLQAVEQAEGKAIESATPKYNGVG